MSTTHLFNKRNRPPSLNGASMKEAPHQPIETPFRFATQPATPAPAPPAAPQSSLVNGSTGKRETAK